MNRKSPTQTTPVLRELFMIFMSRNFISVPSMGPKYCHLNTAKLDAVKKFYTATKIHTKNL